MIHSIRITILIFLHSQMTIGYGLFWKLYKHKSELTFSPVESVEKQVHNNEGLQIFNQNVPPSTEKNMNKLPMTEIPQKSPVKSLPPADIFESSQVIFN